MSLCYDGEKRLKITLSAAVFSLTVGLVLPQYANGYVDPQEYSDDPALYEAIVKFNALQKLVNYCFEHASDSPNPIKDLVDKGLLDPSYQGQDCRTVNNALDIADAEALQLMINYTRQKGSSIYD